MNTLDISYIFNTQEARMKLLRNRIYEVSSDVSRFFEDDAPSKYGYEEREGQLNMAFYILDAIKDNKHIAVEAGVGIGKSFAYLVPLLIYNKKTNNPVIVATSTITLQEQLYADAKRLMELLNIKTDVILAKGQGHYICQQRAEEFFEKNSSEMTELIKASISEGCQDRRSFAENIPNILWEKINISRFNKGKCARCAYRDTCQYFIIRENLKYTNGLILCNQDLLTAHLLAIRDGHDGIMNFFISLTVIDEAHNLEGKVRSITTVRYSQSDIKNVIKSAKNTISAEDRRRVDSDCNATNNAIDKLYSNLHKQIKQQIEKSNTNMKYTERYFFKDIDGAYDLLKSAAENLDNLFDLIQTIETMNTDRYGVRDTNQQAVDDLEKIAQNFFELNNSFDEKLVWLEKNNKYVELLFCPKNTDKVVSRLYFEGFSRTILTSATLTNSANGSIEEQYSYFAKNIGFPTGTNGVLAEPQPSPYPYDKHTLIYFCDDLPHPTTEHEEFIRKGVNRLIQILDISHGKALVLFTAKSDMEEVYSALKTKELPYTILMQQKGSSQEHVLEKFRNDTNSVLLGTGAFWEGISIEGKTLSHLVIFRLPFPVPDPIIEYKCSIAKNSLMEVHVPDMIIKLKQGIGRLIRNFTDKGLVSIIDSRLRDNSSSPYINIVWDSLPIKNRTSNISTAKHFYDNLYALDDSEKEIA